MEKNVQQPEWWYYCINGVHDGFSREMPPEDAYDKGTLTALYTAAPVPRDVLMAFGEEVHDAMSRHLCAGDAVPGIASIADRYASKVKPEQVNQQLLAVARSILVPDMIDLLPPEYVAKVQSAIAAAEAAQPVAVPDGVVRATELAAAAIYFADSSDYLSALWDILRFLSPDIASLAESDTRAAWDRAEQERAMLSAAQKPEGGEVVVTHEGKNLDAMLVGNGKGIAK